MSVMCLGYMQYTFNVFNVGFGTVSNEFRLNSSTVESNPFINDQ